MLKKMSIPTCMLHFHSYKSIFRKQLPNTYFDSYKSIFRKQLPNTICSMRESENWLCSYLGKHNSEN